MTAEEVLDQAAVLLNDASQAFWTDAVLLPCLTKANEELEQEFDINEIPLLSEKQTPVTSVEIGDTELDEYPVDLVEPLVLYERALSSSDNWVEVREVAWVDPNLTECNEIVQWAFRDNKIYINPPQTDREIYLDYRRKLTPITTTGSTIEIPQAKTFLAQRTAQIAAKELGNNTTKALAMQPDVDRALDRLIRRLSKNKQGIGGARRRPYRGRSRRLVY